MDIDSLQVEIEASSDKATEKINKTTEALGGLRKETNRTYKNPITELAGASEVDVLKTKLSMLRQLMEDAISGGKSNKALGYQLRIISTVKALRKAEAAAESFRRVTEEPVKNPLENLANAKEVDTLKAKLTDLRVKMEDAIGGGDASKAIQYRLQIIATEKALKKAEEAAASLQKTSDKPLANPLKDMANASEVDALKAKLGMLKVQMDEAISGGDGKKAIMYRLQILSTERALRKAEEAASDLKRATDVPLKNPISDLANASEIDLLRTKLAMLRQSMEDAISGGDTKKAMTYRMQIIQTERALSRAEAAAKKARDGNEKTSKSFRELARSAASSSSPLARFASSLKRIAFYRLIRSAIKAVGEAFSEGERRAYFFSKTVGGEIGYVADAFDKLSGGSFKMSNQLGAAFATMKAAITPVLLEIIRIVTMAANVITQFFAILGGRTHYMKAIDYSKAWADETAKGAGAAKEWRNQLLGFDEINRLEEPSGGGGGGGSTEPTDWENMFDTAPLEEWTKKVKTALDWIKNHLELIKALALGVGAALATWKLINFGSKLFGITTPLKKVLGYALAIGGAVVYVRSFVSAWNTGINWDNLAGMIGGVAAAAVGLGLALGPTAASIGLIVGGIGMLVVGIREWIETGTLSNETFTAVAAGITAISVAVGMLTGSAGIGLLVAGFAALVLGVSEWIATGELTNRSFITLEAGIAAVGVALSLLTGSWIPLAVVAIAGIALAIYKYWEPIKKWVSDLVDAIVKSFTERFSLLLTGIRTIWEGMRKVFNGIIQFVTGVFTGDWRKAWDGVKLIFSGFKDTVVGHLEVIIGWFQGIISWCKTVHDWIQDLLDGFSLVRNANARANRIQADGSIYLEGFASGGHPDTGQLFVAREAGPELVGTMNGQSTVATNADIVAGIRQGVYEAVSAAMNGQSGGETVVKVYLDSREIKNGQQRYARAMGV